MYPKEQFEAMPPFAIPEVLRIALDSTVLQIMVGPTPTLDPQSLNLKPGSMKAQEAFSL